MKKIAIIGAGISGLFITNLFKKNPDYQITIYEKNTSINCNDVTVSSALRSPLHVCVPKEEYMLVVSDTAHLRVCEALGKVIVFLLDSFEFFLHLLTSFFSTS